MEVQREGMKKVLNVLCVLLFVGLLLLRYPLLILPKFIHVDLSSQTIDSLFTNGTYLLTALMILLLKDKLAQYKFNLLAIVIFLLAPILVPIVNIVFAKGLPYGALKYSKFQIAVSIILCVLLIISHAKVVVENWLYYVKWIVIAIIVGVALGTVIGLVYSHYQTRGQMHATIMLVFLNFITQLSSAAALEEPLFRGFIWGFLEQRGWKQVWIWLLQAALFCFGHLYYLPQYPVFFFGTFVSALVFGLLVWKSKSVGTSMIAHGLENSVADVVMHCIL